MARLDQCKRLQSHFFSFYIINKTAHFIALGTFMYFVIFLYHCSFYSKELSIFTSSFSPLFYRYLCKYSFPVYLLNFVYDANIYVIKMFICSCLFYPFNNLIISSLLQFWEFLCVFTFHKFNLLSIKKYLAVYYKASFLFFFLMVNHLLENNLSKNP